MSRLLADILPHEDDLSASEDDDVHPSQQMYLCPPAPRPLDISAKKPRKAPAPKPSKPKQASPLDALVPSVAAVPKAHSSPSSALSADVAALKRLYENVSVTSRHAGALSSNSFEAQGLHLISVSFPLASATVVFRVPPGYPGNSGGATMTYCGRVTGRLGIVRRACSDALGRLVEKHRGREQFVVHVCHELDDCFRRLLTIPDGSTVQKTVDLTGVEADADDDGLLGTMTITKWAPEAWTLPPTGFQKVLVDAVSVRVGSVIYFVGGTRLGTGQQSASKHSVTTFDIKAFTWKGHVCSFASSKTLQSHAVARWNDWIVIVGGGFQERRRVSPHLLLIDTSEEEVQMKTFVTMPCLHELADCTATVIGDKMYIVGGYMCVTDVPTSVRATSLLLVLDFTKIDLEQTDNNFSAVPNEPMAMWTDLSPHCHGVIPIYGHSATRLGKRVVIHGGIINNESTQSNRTWVLDTELIEFVEMVSRGTAPAVRMYHCAVRIGQRHLVVVGGRSGTELVGSMVKTVDVLDLHTSTWQQRKVHGPEVARQRACAVGLQGKVVMFLGVSASGTRARSALKTIVVDIGAAPAVVRRSKLIAQLRDTASDVRDADVDAIVRSRKSKREMRKLLAALVDHTAWQGSLAASPNAIGLEAVDGRIYWLPRFFVLRSPHYQRAMAAGMREAVDRIIDVKHVSSDTCKTLVCFLLSDTLGNVEDPSIALELIPLGAQLELPGLVEGAESMIVDAFDFDDLSTVFELVDLGLAHDAQQLVRVGLNVLATVFTHADIQSQLTSCTPQLSRLIKTTLKL